MKIKNLVLLAIVLIIGSLIVFRILQNQKLKAQSNDKQGKRPPMTVKARVIQSENYTQTLSLSGTIEPNEQVEIHSEIAGIVEKIFFKEGTFVKKGQALLQINNDDLKAKLAEAVAKEKLASETEQRNRTLLEKSVVSQAEYDVALANYHIAQAQTQLIRVQLIKTNITAPLSGKIGLRTLSEGTYITPSMPITQLMSTQPVKLTFAVPEKYIQEVAVNTSVKFKVNNSNLDFMAKIYAIEPGLDAQTRTLQVKAIADNSKNILYPSTFAKVELPLKYTQAILIPTEAVLPVQSGKKAFVYHNGKAEAKDITTISRTEKDVVVTDGLHSGDTLIVSGIMSLKDKADVKLKIAN